MKRKIIPLMLATLFCSSCSLLQEPLGKLQEVGIFDGQILGFELKKLDVLGLFDGGGLIPSDPFGLHGPETKVSEEEYKAFFDNLSNYTLTFSQNMSMTNNGSNMVGEIKGVEKKMTDNGKIKAMVTNTQKMSEIASKDQLLEELGPDGEGLSDEELLELIKEQVDDQDEVKFDGTNFSVTSKEENTEYFFYDDSKESYVVSGVDDNGEPVDYEIDYEGFLTGDAMAEALRDEYSQLTYNKDNSRYECEHFQINEIEAVISMKFEDGILVSCKIQEEIDTYNEGSLIGTENIGGEFCFSNIGTTSFDLPANSNN